MSKHILEDRINFYLDSDKECRWKYVGLIAEDGEYFPEGKPDDFSVVLGTCQVCGKNPIMNNFVLKYEGNEKPYHYASVGSECIAYLGQSDYLKIKDDQKKLKAIQDQKNAKVVAQYLSIFLKQTPEVFSMKWTYMDRERNLGGSLRFMQEQCEKGKYLYGKGFGTAIRKALKEKGIEFPDVRAMKEILDTPSHEDFRADEESIARSERGYENLLNTEFYKSGEMDNIEKGIDDMNQNHEEGSVKMVPDGYDLVDYYGISPITGKIEIVYETLRNLKTGEEDFPDTIPEWDPVIEVINAVDWNPETSMYEPIDVTHVHLQKYLERNRKTKEKGKENVVSDPVLKALKLLAGDDPDFASTRNNVGFNKQDAEFGHSLASFGKLSDKQREYGKRLIRKYHRQIPPDLWKEIFGEEKNEPS